MYFPRIRQQQGLTIIELLVVMAVMSIVVMAIYSINQSVARTAATEFEVSEVQEEIRRSVDLMTRDLRIAGFMVNGAPIINNTADQLTIRTTAPRNAFARTTNSFVASGTNTTGLGPRLAEAGTSFARRAPTCLPNASAAGARPAAAAPTGSANSGTSNTRRRMVSTNIATRRLAVDRRSTRRLGNCPKHRRSASEASPREAY